MTELCKGTEENQRKVIRQGARKGPGKYVCARLFGACAPGGKSEVSMEDP